MLLNSAPNSFTHLALGVHLEGCVFFISCHVSHFCIQYIHPYLAAGVHLKGGIFVRSSQAPNNCIQFIHPPGTRGVEMPIKGLYIVEGDCFFIAAFGLSQYVTFISQARISCFAQPHYMIHVLPIFARHCSFFRSPQHTHETHTQHSTAGLLRLLLNLISFLSLFTFSTSVTFL